MVITPKRHGWLVGALQDAGYQQRDLAKAWHINDAVVSRFIARGKPDLTPQRQMLLAQMLGLTNDQLLARLYGAIPVPRVLPIGAPVVNDRAPAATIATDDGDVQQEINRFLGRMRELLPDVDVTISIQQKGHK